MQLIYWIYQGQLHAVYRFLHEIIWKRRVVILTVECLKALKIINVHSHVTMLSVEPNRIRLDTPLGRAAEINEDGVELPEVVTVNDADDEYEEHDSAKRFKDSSLAPK